ncbi:MAG: AI-2E family transporter [Bacillota bacterium]
MVRAVLGIAAGTGAAAILFRLRGVLPPFILAIAMVYILSPAVDLLERKGFRRTGAILGIYAVIAVILALVFARLLPALLGELTGLGEAVPGLARDLTGFLERVERGYARTELPEALRQAVDDTVSALEAQVQRLTRSAVDSLLGLFSGLLLAVIAPVVAFYLLRDLEHIKSAVNRALPRESKGQWWAFLDELDAVLGGFIRGQVTIAVIVGALSTLALVLLGVRFAVILGLTAGVFELVPYFGPVLGAMPAVALALLESPVLALKVILAFVLIQQVESVVLAPKIMGDRVGLHPLAVIVAVLAGGQLFGFLGIILAVPGAATVKVVARSLWRLAARAKQGGSQGGV